MPDNAPFTTEQRAYLNGFFAGLFSCRPGPGVSLEPAAPSVPLTPLSILFGSQTGTAENLARRLAKEAGKRGFAPNVQALADYPCGQLANEDRLLIVASTFGDGDPPDNAKTFWEFLNGTAAPRLNRVRFSVCAVGDSSYPRFCGFGRELDQRLSVLGAHCVRPRMDCDVDYEAAFAAWMDASLTALAAPAIANEKSQGRTVGIAHSPDVDVPRATAFNRDRPFAAPLVANLKLSGPGSEKDIRHFEISLAGSDLTYEVGDALGVYPSNCPELVGEMLTALNCNGDETVPGRDSNVVPLREALRSHYEITKIPRALLQTLSERTGDETLKRVASPEANGELGKFLWGREIIDLLLEYRAAQFAPSEFIRLLRKLSPRLYSIASSPKTHTGQVHLTVNILRYESLGRSRKGVCSTFLADRSQPAGPISVFVHANQNFRPPGNHDVPMIMVGPGTGVAPFRAFLHERQAVGAKGRNWLFFGDQHRETDFFYREEWEAMRRDGLLTRLDTAFSRDQSEKIYVQHRMREHAADLFSWLEEGASFYVCGDAARMAKDVDATLHEVVRIGGNRTVEEAREYINRLKMEKRYQRDVY